VHNIHQNAFGCNRNEARAGVFPFSFRGIAIEFDPDPDFDPTERGFLGESVLVRPRRLCYGLATRPAPAPANKENAMSFTLPLAGRPVRVPLTNPIGCNVKWEGKDAHWMPPEACDLV
jgi:hypothetical protein